MESDPYFKRLKSIGRFRDRCGWFGGSSKSLLVQASPTTPGTTWNHVMALRSKSQPMGPAGLREIRVQSDLAAWRWDVNWSNVSDYLAYPSKLSTPTHSLNVLGSVWGARVTHARAHTHTQAVGQTLEILRKLSQGHVITSALSCPTPT